MDEGTSVCAPVFSPTRVRVGDMKLPAAVFTAPVRRHLLYEVVKMQMASRRSGSAATKTRGEVRGGGKKPWRQKGTGWARAGSSRSPLWRGGGTIFGPRPRVYGYRLPKQARRAALCSALSLKLGAGSLLILDTLELPEMKTKKMAELLRCLEVTGSAVIVTAEKDERVEKSARNIPGIKVLRPDGVNVYDLLCHKYLIMTQEAVHKVVKRLVL